MQKKHLQKQKAAAAVMSTLFYNYLKTTRPTGLNKANILKSIDTVMICSPVNSILWNKLLILLSYIALRNLPNLSPLSPLKNDLLTG